jgi:predicted transcriptional regulator
MEMTELRDMILRHDKSITTFDEWAKGIELRVQNVEKSQNLMVEVQISLREIAMSNKYFGEKLDEMKKTLDKIVEENQKQHDELNRRIGNIEDKPATKWENAKWIVVAAALTGLVGYFISKLGVM